MGGGIYGRIIAKEFSVNGISVECFCDSYKSGIDADTNIKIISPQELKEKYFDANIIISIADQYIEESIHNMLLSMGLSKKHIFGFKDVYPFIRKNSVFQISLDFDEIQEYLDGYERIYNFFTDIQSRKIILEILRGYLFNQLFTYEPIKESYFPEQFCFGENEVFIDGGLYIGDTTEEFIHRVNGKYSQIIGFDIDEKNLSVAYKNLDLVPAVKIIAKGLWDCTVSKSAELGIMTGSNVKEGAEDIVDLVSLDEVFADVSEEKYPTFIKLDIEGSEKQALLGAERIIKTVSPKLAVCVYHKPEDVYVLTELLKSFNPNYKFFLKHYTPYIWETVLYAY